MRNLKALFCLVISNHLTLITNTSSLFVYYTISFGYRQLTFISHLLIGLSPFTFLEDGRLLSEKVKNSYHSFIPACASSDCGSLSRSDASFVKILSHFSAKAFCSSLDNLFKFALALSTDSSPQSLRASSSYG